ncbi:MAG: hypothetical protein AAGE52_39400 [Myxococcota bacterium]
MGRWITIALLLACGSEPGLEIVANQMPLDDCSLADEDTGDVIREGVFDLAIGDRPSYVLSALVRNRTAESVTLRMARLRAVDRRTGDPLQITCGEDVCAAWDEDLCDGACPEIPAGEARSIEVPAMPRVLTAFFLGQMDDAVREGRTPPEFDIDAEIELLTDGEAASSFVFPLRLCLGCLVSFPEGTDRASIPGPDCCGAGTPVEDGCYPGQDVPFSCRRCVSTVPELCNFGRRICE